MDISKQHLLRSINEVTQAAETLATTIVYSDNPYCLQLTLDCADAGLMLSKKLDDKNFPTRLTEQYISICQVIADTYAHTQERQLKRTALKCAESARICGNYLKGQMGRTYELPRTAALSA